MSTNWKNLEEIEKFLETESVKIKRLIIKKIPTNKSPDQTSSQVNSAKHLKKS